MARQLRWTQQLIKLLAIAGTCSLSLSASVQAVQLANGQVFFDSAPRLLKAATTYSSTEVSGATYYFEIDLPENAGEPLQQIQIQQREGFDRVNFNPARTRAFLGKRRGEEVLLEAVDGDDEERVTVTFAEAIAPGHKLVLALKPHWNPDTGGVYLFGVTALPAGESVHPQFLGYGRLHFYERRGFFGLRH